MSKQLIVAVLCAHNKIFFVFVFVFCFSYSQLTNKQTNK